MTDYKGAHRSRRPVIMPTGRLPMQLPGRHRHVLSSNLNRFCVICLKYVG